MVLIAAVLIWLLSRAGSAFGVMLPARTAAMFSLIAVGAVISAWGAIPFRRAGTTVNPLKPGTASSLVVSGIYQWTRIAPIDWAIRQRHR